jgi:membrane protein implicated in regulation of membrane protease activity
MYWLFMICAAVGGTVFICQFVMAIVGAGTDDVDFAHDIPHDLPHDIPHDFSGDVSGDAGHATPHGHVHGSTWLFGVISFRTVVAALTFFGLAGLASRSASLSSPIALLIAISAGAAALYGVHFLMQSLYRLRTDGTVQIHRTMGERGTVYVPIPPNNEGLGKIQIRTQGRIMEYAARTRGPNKLRTGTTVEVVEILSPMTVEVEPLDAVVPAVPDHVDHDGVENDIA